MRPSDRQRERTVVRLQSAYLTGAISADTFEARAALAYGSRSLPELARLVRDLPTLVTRFREAYATFFWPERAAPVAAAWPSVVLPAAEGARIVLGRHAGCEVVLGQPSVSRRHLEIAFDGRRWEARDLGSRNGTLLNGHRLIRAVTVPGDVFQLGEAHVQLVAPPR